MNTSYATPSSSSSSSSLMNSFNITTTSWEQVRLMMNQLENLCTTAGDHQLLETLRKNRLDLQDIFGASETNAKRALLDLSKTLASEQASSTELLEPIDRIRAQIQQLEEKKTAIVAHISAMQQMKDTSEAAIKRLLSNTLQYKDMIQALHKDEEARVPRTTHFLTLYAIITAIKWDYDSPNVQGYIAPPKGAPVRTFSIDPHLLPCTIADTLWDTIGTAHGLPK